MLERVSGGNNLGAPSLTSVMVGRVACSGVLALFLSCRAAAGEATVEASPVPEGKAVATFAGGCFWCMEPPFDRLLGVEATLVGYTGGSEAHPSYRDVAYGRTGHRESIRVVYDPDTVGYNELLDVFWMNVDPTDDGGQFVDRGAQYAPAIFVHDEAQRKAANASKMALEASGRFSEPVVVPVLAAQTFWIAEDYHQDFYRKEPRHYKRYRYGSGRDQFIQRHWHPEEK
ncbi:MAG: peptide-methionine (S)-S-oxide reductase MsrA [Myxococcota bacterium]